MTNHDTRNTRQSNTRHVVVNDGYEFFLIPRDSFLDSLFENFRVWNSGWEISEKDERSYSSFHEYLVNDIRELSEDEQDDFVFSPTLSYEIDTGWSVCDDLQEILVNDPRTRP